MKKITITLLSSLFVLSACNINNSASKGNSGITSSTSSSVTSSSSTTTSTNDATSSSSTTSNTITSSSSSSSVDNKNDELQQLTIAEFLNKKDTENFYILSGTVTKITNTQYGNFILEDSTGSIFVWGLYMDETSTDKFGFPNLNIKEGDKITIAGVYYYYEKDNKDEVKDAYFISKDSSGNGGGGNTSSYLYSDFTAAEKKLFMDYFGEVIPFIPNDEYYVEEYSYDEEKGINFYAFGNTEAEFEAYLELFNDFVFSGTDVDEYGDTWYFYDKGDILVDVSYYVYEGSSVIDLYIYTLPNGSSGESGTTDNIELITNEGKGLPTSNNGVYDVDFTKAKYVKNVTEQGYYLDGCPTQGTPAVLVVPVEFSDITAKSKGYSIDKIEKAFKGSEGDTDYESVHDYYYTSSYGKLDLDITVLDSWFMPENESSYYATATIDYFGQEIEAGDQLIIDELLASLEGTIDLSKFDSDKNGFIDSIVLINTLDINDQSVFNWAYRYWNLYTDDEGYYFEYDGVSANDYLWASYQFMFESYDEEGYVNYDDQSVMNTYTYIHEFGHVLGADDYYDTAYIGAPLDGCDIMDSMTGDHNAFTKFNFGWLTTSRLVVAEESVTLELEDFSKNGDSIIIANNWDEELGAYQEYYIVVYYTNNGLNSGDYGYFARDGIVVYHINASLYSEDYDGVTYYDIYNNNTDVSDQNGTQDNLIEFIKSPEDTFTYVEGDSLSSSIVDDQGNTISYTFVVDSLTATSATLTFTKN